VTKIARAAKMGMIMALGPVGYVSYEFVAVELSISDDLDCRWPRQMRI
jgi:hypothetical protein